MREQASAQLVSTRYHILMDKAKLVAVLLALNIASCKHEPTKPQHKEVAKLVVQVPPVTVVAPHVVTRQELLEPLLEQVKQEEAEMLPFDEPRHEYGLQLDGKLREQWMKAYYTHQPTYNFNGDKYYTMFKGKPFVPQVCIDFVIDTLDRTAGTWYSPSLKHPRRVVGRYDFRNFIISQHLNVRSAPDVIEFFKQYPDSFEFIFDGSSPMTTGETKQLQAWLKQLNVQVGDLVLIKGRAPWDHGKEIHWHSMFVTGLNEQGEVQLVTGNPVYPIERTLRIEGNRAPKRHVVAIVRFTDKFLGEITGLVPKVEM